MSRIHPRSWPAVRILPPSSAHRHIFRGDEKLRILLRSAFLAQLLGLLIWSQHAIAEDTTPPATARAATSEAGPAPVVFTTQQDHQNMLEQLGIKKLRPGRNPNEGSTNPPNYDETQANPYPILPDVMKLQNGERVTSAEQWRNARRPEIVELLENQVYGRVPQNVPVVKWEVRTTREIEVAGKPAIQKHIVGVVDNSACPEITVNISMSLTLPKEAAGPIPVLMTFGWTPFEPNPFAGFGRRGDGGGPRPPSREEKLIGAGWGCAILNPNTVQADSGGWQRNPFARNATDDGKPTGAGLTRGIIGLVNRGQPRKPDDWGALRAWGWGASRGLDYLERESAVNAKRVGIAGVSRYGKAALVAMAFDERFAMGLIASSGAGGTKLFRRNFGESLENLAGSGGYHWMAGNYIKFSAEESTFGRHTADDMPVDSHETLALCAPRLTFISHGIPERGDANWLDHQGSYMAAIAAQPVFRLLGARGLGRSDDYQNERMPAVNFDLLEGELAWRQHDGGHTDEPNIEHFIRWADIRFARQDGRAPAIAAVGAVQENPAPGQRTDPNSVKAHEQLLAKARHGKIDVYFVGDSITRRWGATDYPKLLAHWKKHFHGWNAANFGWGGDTTQNILWRLTHGELEGVSPKVIVLQAGTNNLPGTGPGDGAKVEEVVAGIKEILHICRQNAPEATIVLTGLFPRTQNPSLKGTIEKINQGLSALADGKRVRFLDISDQLADSEGRLRQGISSDGLHLEEPGYEIWAAALKPIFTEILGPAGTEDRAPPPTGNPAAGNLVAVKEPGETAASRPTTPGGAEVPEAVRIKRPTAEELAIAEEALKRFVASADPRTQAVLQEFPALIEVRTPRPNLAIVPGLAPFFRQKHEANLAVAKEGTAELLLMGDSITDFWRNDSGPYAGKKVLEKYFGKWRIANFGIAGDTTQGVLYRLQNGEGTGFSPKAVMLMIGTNNIGRNTADEIAEGIGAVTLQLRKSFPEANILLLGVFPRAAANDPVRTTVAEINQKIAKLDDGQKVHYLEIGAKFLDAEGNIPRDVMSDALHPSSKGYEIWAEAVVNPLTRLMGEESAE